MKLAKALLILIGIMALLIVIFIGYKALSGRMSISAESEHHWLTAWALQTSREKAVARKVREIDAKLPDLENETVMFGSVIGYEDMCATCHTPPGGSPTPLAQGLNPPAPDLAEAATMRSPEELFWTTKYGIRMSGMPAWGVTHDDGELWPIIALITRFPDFTDGDYEDLLARAREAGVQHDHGDHDHASHPGEHEHQNEATPSDQEKVNPDHEDEGNHRHADDVEHDMTHEEHDHDH